MKDCTIIIGSYRSGTSVIAKILNSLGINMGERENANDNPDWYPTGSFNDKYTRYIYTNPKNYWDLKLKTVQQGKIGTRSFEFLKKDAWSKFMSETLIQTSIIWAKRNINKANIEYSMLMGDQAFPDTIEKQYNTAENIFNNFSGRKLIVNYSDLMQNTESTAKQIAAFCGVFYIDGCINGITPKFLE